MSVIDAPPLHSRSRRRSALGLLVALAVLVALPVRNAAAESNIVRGNGALDASATLRFRIIVPARMQARLAVKPGGTVHLATSLRSGPGALTITTDADPRSAAGSEVLSLGSGHFALDGLRALRGVGSYTVASP